MSAIGHFFARKFLIRQSPVHAEEFPQVACFAFDQITNSISLEGRYEKDILTFLAKSVFPTLPQGGVCLDIGANIGNHSLAFAEAFSKVIAFEPHPRTFKLLSINTELASNIEPVNLGLSDEETQFEVVEDRANLGASSIHKTGGADVSRVTFDVKRLDDLAEVQALPNISFMKLDIEGHEVKALQGAEQTIAKHQPVIMVEVLPHEVQDGWAAALDVLKGFGYGHFYEAVEGGALGQMPRRRKKLARTLLSVFTGRRPPKAEVLKAVETLEPRSYPMVLCSVTPLAESAP